MNCNSDFLRKKNINIFLFNVFSLLCYIKNNAKNWLNLAFLESLSIKEEQPELNSTMFKVNIFWRQPSNYWKNSLFLSRVWCWHQVVSLYLVFSVLSHKVIGIFSYWEDWWVPACLELCRGMEILSYFRKIIKL